MPVYGQGKNHDSAWVCFRVMKNNGKQDDVGCWWGFTFVS